MHSRSDGATSAQQMEPQVHSRWSQQHTSRQVDHQLNATRAGPHADLGMLMAEPFVMPYDTMLPKAAEATNLLVPVAVSSSHVRFNAVRLEPTWMILGHAAGAAAALCVQEGVLPHTVNVTQLQDLLVAQKQMLRP